MPEEDCGPIMAGMRILPIALLALTGISFAFQDFHGFRYGNTAKPWATARRNGTVLVAGNLTDSSCCSWDSTSSFFSSPLTGPYPYSYTAWFGSFDTAGNPVASKRLWAESPSRWFGMEVDSSGAATTVGAIQDTVFFEKKKRITAQGVVEDTVSSEVYVGSEEQLRLGGGGGIGVAHWNSDGARQWLRLFRLKSLGTFLPTGWDVHVRPSGGLSLSGSISLADSEPVLYGNDTVTRLPSGTSIVLAGMSADGSGAWLCRSFTGLYASPPVHVWTPRGLWLAQGDSVASPSGPSGWLGSRPILVRYDTLGNELERLHPLGDMRGGFLAAASREDGALLLQGEQASDLSWNGATVSPVWDSVPGKSTHRSSFLLLLDSQGQPQRYRSLSGIGYVGSWKILRVAGKGWLLLGWDQHDVVGFSRLFLLDDSLNVQEMSDSLPPTLGIDLDASGNITLSGYLWSTARAPAAWLSGSGTQWNATCRFGQTKATTGLDVRRSMPSHLTNECDQLVVHLGTGETGVLEIRLADGRLQERRQVVDGERCALPLGASIVRLRFPSGEVTGKFVRP